MLQMSVRCFVIVVAFANYLVICRGSPSKPQTVELASNRSVLLVSVPSSTTPSSKFDSNSTSDPLENPSTLPIVARNAQTIDKVEITRVANDTLLTGQNTASANSEQKKANETRIPITETRQPTTTPIDATETSANERNRSISEGTTTVTSAISTETSAPISLATTSTTTTTTTTTPATTTQPMKPTIPTTTSVTAANETTKIAKTTKDKNTVASKVSQLSIKPTDDGMSSGIIALVMAIAFAVVVVIVYAGLLLWRRYLEYRYGNRELLVNDLEFDTNDLRHFEL